MRRLRLLALIAVLALATAACGDDSTTPASQSSTPPGSTSSPLTDKGTKDVSTMSSFTVEIDDFYFSPTFMKVKDGQKLSIELENQGAAQHTFTIASPAIDKTLNPGQKMEVEITFTGTADLAFFCRFHGGGGMRGAFFFGSAPQGGTGGTSGTPDRY